MLFGAGPLKVVSQVFVLKGAVIQGALVAGEKSVGVTLESNSYVLKNVHKLSHAHVMYTHSHYMQVSDLGPVPTQQYAPLQWNSISYMHSTRAP